MMTISGVRVVLRWCSLLIMALVCSGCAQGRFNQDSPNADPLLEPVAEEPSSAPPNGSIYQHHTSRLLFEDLKAKRQGDLITVILDERTVAAKNASTNASRSTAIDIPAPTLLGKIPSLNGKTASTSLESGSGFNGKGDSSQSNSLLGNITVSVTEIKPNGNLVIRGEKQLTLNSGLEIVSVSGVVRPTDITPQNTIASNLIANANIVYSGKGMIADNNRSGWLSRIFTSRFWPF